MELKSVSASVFFSSDEGNPDTARHFYCDMQMYTTTMTAPDPEYFMRQFVSWEAASKANKWQGRNVPRWANAEYDAAFKESQAELDLVKRAVLFIGMNDLVVGDPGVIPDVYRPRVSALSKKLHAPLSGWDNDFWSLKDWYREA
jgi:peptide/nickel transport system substrate-binding protein